MSQGSEGLRQAVGRLWAIPRPGPENLLSDSRFTALQDACQAAYPQAGNGFALSFALSNAVRALGLPSALVSDRQQLATTPDEATSGLVEALERTETQRVHLCPLDLADTLPTMSFGPCTVHGFSADDLAGLFGKTVLERSFAGVLDTKRFSQFTWLLVRETAPVDGEPGKRAAPFFYENMRTDSGRIEPHSNKLPALVERSLFFMLLAPWEQWSTLSEVDWRPFRVPWTYTCSNDIFEHRVFPQSPDSLGWELKFLTDNDGETIEFEVPINLPLKEEAQSAAGMLTDDYWKALQTALMSPLFETPVVHFLNRAFLSEGIDEFLAHLTAIEAALGLESDYGKGPAAATRPRKDVRGASRMAARVSALLGSAVNGAIYSNLFDLRSAFVHGRPMGPISTADRVQARSLARRVTNALIEAALQQPAPTAREHFANELLDRGLKMKP